MYGRHIDDRDLTFEFGEGLIHDNLLFVDRETDSVWSQLHGEASAGPLKDTPLPLVPFMQVTWKYWRALHPETSVWLPEGDGRPYYYRDFEPGGDRPPHSDRHDLARLGLGLVVAGNTMFFPISELEQAVIPAIVTFGDKTIAVYYDKTARGAWAVDANLQLLPAVLVYDWAWANFFPDSGVYKVGAEF